MTQYERMVKGLIYDPGDEEIIREQTSFQERLYEFNLLRPSDIAEKQRYMKELFAECGENCYFELPFRANWGGHHVHLGSGVYANFNLTLVDDGHIYVGDKVMFGPNVTVTTAGHPIDPTLRSRGLQFNKDVYIGENACVGVSFMTDLGSVTISLTNLTTMINVNRIVNSSCGNCYIPITGGPGLYCIEFLTEDGARYYGYFAFT